MLVNAQGHFLTQREYPQLTQAHAYLSGEDNLTLILPHKTFTMALEEWRSESSPTLMLRSVKVWEDHCQAVIAPSPINLALSTWLGESVTLVYMPEETRRQVDRNYATSEDLVSFADGFPLLITTSASLENFNQYHSSPITMERFRPNLVIANTVPYAVLSELVDHTETV